MGQALLVDIDITAGSQVIDALDGAGIKVSMAMWGYLSAYERWDLLIAARALDVPSAGYHALNDALEAAGIPFRRIPDIMIMPMNSPFVKALRKAFRSTSSVEGMRLGGQRFGEHYLEDSYVYRIK